MARPFTESAEAWTDYARGRAEMLRNGSSPVPRAEQEFRAAVDLDPGFGLAYARLAELHAEAAEKDRIESERRTAEAAMAKSLAAKALELDQCLSDAHAILARLARSSGLNLREAQLECRRALRTGPNNPRALLEMALVGAAGGHLGRAARLLKKAWSLSPLSPEYPSYLSWVFLLTGDLDGAISYGQLAKTMSPDFADPYWHLGLAYLLEGMPIMATKMFNDYMQRGGDGDLGRGAVALAERRAGRGTVADGLLEKLNADFQNDSFGAYALALGRLDSGSPEAILSLLERAFEQHESRLVYLKKDPLFRKMRRNPRFTALLGRMGCR